MSKSLSLAKVSVKSGFNLFWGAAICTILSSIEIIVIARLLSPSDYGIYSVALTAPNLIKTFRDLGIDQSTIRYTAKYAEEKQKNNIKNVLAATTTFEVILGATLSFATFLLADFLGTNMFNRPDIVPFIQMASLIILADALLKTAQSAFIGYEKMSYQSLTLILYAVLRIVIMPLFVIFGLAAYGAVLGFTIAYLLAGIIAMLLFYKKIYQPLHDQKVTKGELLTELKAMFRYGLPLSAATILDSFLLRAYSFLLAIYSTDVLIGNYHVAGSFTVLMASLFLAPLRTSLFPTYSKIDAQKEPETLKSVFQSSVKFASLLVVPVTVAIMVLSKPAISTFFGDAYQYTPLYLTIFVISYLYTTIGYYNTNNLIKSQGKTAVNLKLESLKFVLGLSLSLLLIPMYGVIGLMTASAFSIFSMLIVGILWIKKNYGVTINWKASAKILASSATAAVPTYLFSTQQILPNWITLILGLTIHFVIYMISISLTGAITKEDTQKIKEILQALGPLAPILTKPVNLIDFLLSKSQRIH